MDCCSNIKKLPLQGFCQTIDFPLVADGTGVYELVKATRDLSIATKTFDDGDTIVFDNIFNENETMTFYVLGLDGEKMQDVDGNDCFRITITPFITDLDA